MIFINLITPYRGLVLYHGLAEGMKNQKQIIIMMPASLRTNYIEELKNCGDEIYKNSKKINNAIDDILFAHVEDGELDIYDNNDNIIREYLYKHITYE